MGLLTEEVEIRLNYKNTDYYLGLGYKPTPYYTKSGKLSYHHVILKVKTFDLLPCTNVNIKVKVKCDCCGIEKTVTYASYSMCNRNGLYYCKTCAVKMNRGENHYRWNNSKTIDERINDRNIDGYTDFIKRVMARDNYVCQCCGKKDNLQVHHLDGYNWCIEGRLLTSNGITLCYNCHSNFHLKYGKGDNTKEQFNEWFGTSTLDLSEYNGVLPSSRKVYCIETDTVYDGVYYAAKVLSLDASKIYDVCNKKQTLKKYTLKNGESKLRTSTSLTTGGKHFMWYDEYLNISNDELKFILEYDSSNRKKIICMTTKKIFESIKEASLYYKCGSSGICNCCKNKRKTCGQLPNGTKLKWMYYEDYIKNCNDSLFINKAS